MKDYLKDLEYILNPMKKIYDELNPMKDIMDSISSFNSSNSVYLSSSFSLFEEFQKKMEYDLNPLKQLQDEMINMFNPFKEIQDHMNDNYFNFISQLNFLEKSINPMKNVIEAFNSINSSIHISKIQELNKLLKSLDSSSISVDETIQNELEKQIDSLKREDKKILDEVIDSLKYIFPNINYLSEKLSKREYIPIIIYIIIYIIWVVIPEIYSKYEEYFKQNIISDSYYKINRNKVRVRTEPSTDNNSIIIIKLNKNVFVEKVDSHKNWLKIEFEDDNGEEKQGWVRRDMLTKIENE
ncbi:SH3 domain-containing protein [Aliarcobacter butzleri]|uniref:SH3 domain-containing protein n=1 Tax=Aliarcobacter butzleri TaxID=28197 RepID=UPI001587AD61|nr:SH3 domain-containing protein [Aliarcobacter butzleri]NUW29569.1 SH3 domain-containing protein [Aliarcobacter butzleri]